MLPLTDVHTPTRLVSIDDSYGVEFMFDADCDCTITLHIAAQEQTTKSKAIVYHPKVTSDVVGPFTYGPGYNQKFTTGTTPIIALTSRPASVSRTMRLSRKRWG